MGSGSQLAHGESISATKGDAEARWFQETPAPSWGLVRLIGAQPSSAIVDIGGGESRFVDSLMASGFENVTVLDISARALAMARARLGEKGGKVKWIVADVLRRRPSETYDVRRKRATFRFFAEQSQQAAYVQRLKAALRRGGRAIIGAFALDGPDKCSGLPLTRYSAGSLGAPFGSDFVLIDSRRHDHKTPWETVRPFQFSTFRLGAT